MKKEEPCAPATAFRWFVTFGTCPTDEELHAAHDAREHSAGLVDGCADCQIEVELDAEEKAGDAEPAKRTSQRAPKK